MEKFYVIKLINTRTSERGYLIDSPKGITISINGIHSDVTQFESFQKAQDFIREKKLERRGVKAYIRDNQDLMRDSDSGAKVMEKEMFMICNLQNIQERLHFNSSNESYYFKEQNVGACIWETEKQAQDFIDHYKLSAMVQKLEIRK